MLFQINLSTKLTSFVLRKDHSLGKKKRRQERMHKEQLEEYYDDQGRNYGSFN